MDTAGLHRIRHPRRRRFRAGRGGRGALPQPAQRARRRRGRRGTAHDLDPDHARQHRHRPGAALRDGPGIADRARHDGGRRNERRLESRAREGGAGSRRLRKRVHGPGVYRRFHPKAPRSRVRLRNLSPRPLVRTAADRGLVGGSWHGSLRDDRGRRRGAGDARRRRRREVRRARLRVQGRQLAHRARRHPERAQRLASWPPRQRSTRCRRGRR